MNREKYIFNPATLQYERQESTLKNTLYSATKYLSAVVFTSLVVFGFGYKYLPTPKEKALEREIDQMEFHYQNLSSQLDQLTGDIDQLQKKDADVHRAVFGMDPIDDGVWNGGIGGREKLVHLGNNLEANELLDVALTKLDKLKRKVDLQSESMDSIGFLAELHADKLASVPSIKPIQEDKLKRKVRHMSGFGMRLHPVHKLKKMHEGIDFTAPRGTPIQSTGNGKVVKVQKIRTGYGNNVTIDHGFGYTTLYGHMADILVKKGDVVTKGQQIGTVGSSGTSTAPHCHYEVRVNGHPVNPINYVMDGLTPEEYQELVIKASAENQSLD